MKKYSHLFFVILGVLSMLSCEATGDGKKCAEEFFTLLIEEDYKSASKLMDVPVGNSDQYISELQVLGNDPARGKLLKVMKKIGFDTNISNGVTTVKLSYYLKYESDNVEAEVTVVNRGNGFRISSVL